VSESPFVRIEIDHGERLVKVIRLGNRFGSETDVEDMMVYVRHELRAIPRATHGVLLDLRAATLPDETTYALQLRDLRRELSQGFRRYCCLVQTRIGLLQIQRLLREEKISAPVIDDEAKALEYLRQP
jgi:hypothetical protein